MAVGDNAVQPGDLGINTHALSLLLVTARANMEPLQASMPEDVVQEGAEINKKRIHSTHQVWAVYFGERQFREQPPCRLYLHRIASLVIP
jgi:hypothetical protein